MTGKPSTLSLGSNRLPLEIEQKLPTSRTDRHPYIFNNMSIRTDHNGYSFWGTQGLEKAQMLGPNLTKKTNVYSRLSVVLPVSVIFLFPTQRVLSLICGGLGLGVLDGKVSYNDKSLCF
jgi:hypothetical protein